jgi:hypothetical protein
VQSSKLVLANSQDSNSASKRFKTRVIESTSLRLAKVGHRVNYNGSLGLNDYMKTLKQMEYFIFTTDGGDQRLRV